MQSYKVGLLIGRFQPFHKGHLYLLKKSLAEIDKLIIGIGTPDRIDKDNPFTFEQRKKMLEKVIKEESWGDKIIAIIPITDYLEDDQLWLQKTLKTVEKIGKFEVFVGNDAWTSGIFEKNGYKVLRFGFYKRYLLEGVKIRRLMREGREWKNRVPEYIVTLLNGYSVKKNNVAMFQFNNLELKQFSHLILGGTFDHFHKGHEKFLDLGFKLGKKITIGISQKNLYKNKLFASTVEDFVMRKKSVVNYLEKNTLTNRAQIIEIRDVFGTSLTDMTIEGIVVTKETRPNALMINKIRNSRNLLPLKIIIAPFIYDEEKKIISSERIREGVIDRSGRVYFNIFGKKRKLFLPENLRERLRKSLGKEIRGNENNLSKAAKEVLRLIDKSKYSLIISVGDIVSMSLMKAGFIPNISVVDLRSRRKEIVSREQNFIGTKLVLASLGLKHLVPQNFIHFETTNNPGTIYAKAVETIKSSLKQFFKNDKNQLIEVKGEEDLLTLPAILLAPLRSIVLYGQWNLGVVVVEVTEEKKQEVLDILRKFD